MNAADCLLSLLFPMRCPLCGNAAGWGRAACVSCTEKLEQLQGVRRFRLYTKNGAQFMCCHYVWTYEGALRHTLHELKFRGKRIPSRQLGILMAGIVLPQLHRFDGITFVPMRADAIRTRGYNQSRLIAQSIAGRTGLPLLSVLEKIRSTQAQHSLRREERMDNIRGAFAASERLEGRRLLLVDDIITTGATISQCAAALYAAGCAEVTGICAAASSAHPQVKKTDPAAKHDSF